MTNERNRPKTKYRITEDRWCWCGRVAPFVVLDQSGLLIEPACSEEHGAQVIRWIENGVVSTTTGTSA